MLDPRVGRMLKRNFHHLEIIESTNGPLPKKLMPGDAVGARVIENCDPAQIVVFGRLAMYLTSSDRSDWKTVPYGEIETWKHNGAGPGTEKLLIIKLSDGETLTILTSELSGLLSAIAMKSALKRLASRLTSE